MKVIGIKTNESTSDNPSEQDQKEAERQREDDREIVEVPVANRSDAMSAVNVTAHTVRIFIVSGYHQSDVFVWFEQIKDSDAPLRTVSLSHIFLLYHSLVTYGFDYSLSTLSTRAHSMMNSEDVTTPSTGVLAIGGHLLRNGLNVLLLVEHHDLQIRWQLHVEGDVSWIQQHILVCLIVREDRWLYVRGAHEDDSELHRHLQEEVKR